MNNLAADQTNSNFNSNTNSSSTNNVVGFIPETPYNRIMSFIDSYESKNTRTAYIKNYKNMFKFMCNKELETLTYEDIKSIDDIKVENYRKHLREGKGYKASTVNSMIASCKALYDKFKERRIVDVNDFDIKPLLQSDNSYGSLTTKEIEDLFEFCLEQTYKSQTLKLYFEFLYTVTSRKTATQELTWEQINKELDFESGTMIWVCTFFDKGKEVKKAIQDSFYTRLMDNYKNNNEISGKVFNIHNHTIDKVLKAFCVKYGIDEKRNISQHSLKSSGLDHVMNITGNINTVALAGQHKSTNTAFKRYINKSRKLTEHPSYFLGKNFSISMLSELSKEELLGLIESSGNETVAKLCLEMDRQGKKEE